MPPFFARPRPIRCHSLGKLAQHRGSTTLVSLPALKTPKYLIEPVASVSPKVTAGDDAIKIPKVSAGSSATLMCPAQAYPVPFYR